MVVRLKIVLEQAEYSALFKMAMAELRNPPDQTRFILRSELERRGFLTMETAMKSPETIQALDTQANPENEEGCCALLSDFYTCRGCIERGHGPQKHLPLNLWTVSGQIGTL